MDPRLLLLCAGAVVCANVVTESPYRPCQVAYKGKQTSHTNLLINEIHRGSTVLDLSNACPWYGWQHVGSQVIACSDDHDVEVLFSSIDRAAVISSNDADNIINAIVSCESLYNNNDQSEIATEVIVDEK